MVTGEVLRMMDCGKQAAKLTIPVLLVFAFLLSRSGRRLTLQIQAVLYTACWLWPVVGRQRYFGNTGDLRLLECYCKWWYYDRRRPLLPAAPIAGATTRKRRGSTLPQRLAI
jgi:hypothetical protein